MNLSVTSPMIPVAKPLIGDEEKAAVLAVLDSGQLVQGEITQRFETEFARLCQARYAVAVSSGTAALHLSLLAHGIGPGDEVITSPFTFIASANSVLFCGARPVFVDIEPRTFNLNPDLIEAAITPRTKAILPIHLYGNPADIPAIQAIADRHGFVVIEDAAQAHAAKIAGQPIGSGNTACFSFYPTKNMTTGEGGIVTTNDAAIADRVRLLRAHGAVERYQHLTLGYNFRMTDLQAAIGLAQLPKLRGWTARRRNNAARLTDLLGYWVMTPVARDWAYHVYHQYTIRIVGGRGNLAKRLATRGIGTSVHYPIPVHQQPLYRDLGYDLSLPEAERASREVISLPIHPSVSAEDLELIASEVIDLLRGKSPLAGEGQLESSELVSVHGR
jgi:perosamine synthetase